MTKKTTKKDEWHLIDLWIALNEKIGWIVCFWVVFAMAVLDSLPGVLMFSFLALVMKLDSIQKVMEKKK